MAQGGRNLQDAQPPELRPGRKTLSSPRAGVPTRDITAVQLSLRRAMEHGRHVCSCDLVRTADAPDPANVHRVNKFTEAYQTIIDSYGVATYQEVKPRSRHSHHLPVPLRVMFGDIGHGVIAFLAAAAMIVFEKKLLKGGSMRSPALSSSALRPSVVRGGLTFAAADTSSC